mmetsp:Transcript_21781/g.32961  ORF Transcript_21781/g.32961 Transcript_21781/m.32961 type:complete len:567 (-) Transcript_21781:71-1771(-)
MAMSSFPFLTAGRMKNHAAAASNNNNGTGNPNQTGAAGQSSDYSMVEALEPTPINPTILATHQHQPLLTLQNHTNHLLNVSQQLQFASQNGMVFNQNNLLAAQVHPALYAQTGPLLNNFQDASMGYQPNQNSICQNPFNVANKPMGYPSNLSGIPGATNLALGVSAPKLHQAQFAAPSMNRNFNPMAIAENAAAMNVAAKALDVSPDAGLPSIKPGIKGTKKMDLISSTDQQNQDVRANLDRLTLKLQGIQEQLKKNGLIDSLRANNLAEEAALSIKRKNQGGGLKEAGNVKGGIYCSSDIDYSSSDECKPLPSKKRRISASSDDADEEEDATKSYRSNKKWEKMFKLLVKFAKREGHCNVYRYHEEENEKLGMWLCRQRIYHKQRGLDSKLALRLEQCGVVWSVSHAEKMMNLMYQYKMREGNCEVPRFHVEDGMKLGIWLQDQKQQRKRNNLSEERIYRLNKLGIIWDIHDDRWTKMYNLWLEYIRNTGHPNVPRSYSVNGHKLGMWLHTQRKFKKRGAMTDKRSDLLEKAGIVWDVLKECNTRAYTNGMYKDENGRTRRKRLY